MYTLCMGSTVIPPLPGSLRPCREQRRSRSVQTCALIGQMMSGMFPVTRVVFHRHRLGREPIKGKWMTSAMWGIVAGMALMFATSLYRYSQRAAGLQSANPSAIRPAEEGRRDRYGL